MSIRAESSEEMTQVLSTSSAASMSTTTMPLWALANSYWAFDDFAMLDEDGEPIVTYTYTVNDANELTAMYDGTTTNFTYDDWGRQTSKYTQSYDADYEYRYSHKLASVTSNFPGEGAVDYLYGGDGKRRARTAGAEETWYDTDYHYLVLAEEEDALGDGDLARTYIAGKSAYINGTTPSGAAYHVLEDHVASPRGVRESDKDKAADHAYNPHGQKYSHTGLEGPYAYTGLPWDQDAQLFAAQFRYYSPNQARWNVRDPAGLADGANVYAYVHGDPVNYVDPLGLQGRPPSLEWPRGPRGPHWRPPQPGRPNLVPHYGNYCGPSWVCGQWSTHQPADWEPPFDEVVPRNLLDDCCRTHDMAYHDCDVLHRRQTNNPDAYRTCTREADRTLADCACGEEPMSEMAERNNLQWPHGVGGILYGFAVRVIFPIKGGGGGYQPFHGFS